MRYYSEEVTALEEEIHHLLSEMAYYVLNNCDDFRLNRANRIINDEYYEKENELVERIIQKVKEDKLELLERIRKIAAERILDDMRTDNFRKGISNRSSEIAYRIDQIKKELQEE